MTGPDNTVFDGPAFFAAIDKQRGEGRLSWPDLGRATGVSPGTIKRFATGDVIEADGVLALTRWLGRPLEDFSPANAHLNSGKAPAPALPGTMLRRDTVRLYQALVERSERGGVSMTEIAAEIEISPAQLRGFAKGGRTNIRRFLCVLNYLEADFHQFTQTTRF